MYIPNLRTLPTAHEHAKAAEASFGVGAFQRIAWQHLYPINHCYWNVDRHVQEYGGAMVTGWQIFLWPEQYIQAVHHAVWLCPDGTLLDIAEKLPSDVAEFTTFAPDRTIPAPLDRPVFVPNKFYRISSTIKIENLIEADHRALEAQREHADLMVMSDCEWHGGVGWVCYQYAPGVPEARAKMERTSCRLTECYQACV